MVKMRALESGGDHLSETGIFTRGGNVGTYVCSRETATEYAGVDGAAQAEEP